MNAEDDDLLPRLRMPISFGPAPGPRNLPAAHRHCRYEKDIATLAFSARTDADLLARMLPAGLALDGEARLEVSVTAFRNIGWLAGRGYNILMVRIPAVWREADALVPGFFVPVVWENMADPIVTGRDELGWPKIYAEIADPAEVDGTLRCEARWDRHRFFSGEAAAFAPAGAIAPQGPMVFHKYVPRTDGGEGEGGGGAADVDYLTVSAPDGPAPTIHGLAQGVGHFAFHAARWDDMPTQYPIVNALAALPLADFGPVIRLAASGGGDGSAQRALRLQRAP